MSFPFIRFNGPYFPSHASIHALLPFCALQIESGEHYVLIPLCLGLTEIAFSSFKSSSFHRFLSQSEPTQASRNKMKMSRPHSRGNDNREMEFHH